MKVTTSASRTRGDKLILVVGTSGSGKDTLIYEAARLLRKAGAAVHIVRRWITRQAHHSENFRAVSVKEFLAAEQSEEFALSWCIYGLHYGIPRTIEEKLARGETVLANVSRGVLQKARRLYPGCKIVKIDVPPDVSEKRVRSRVVRVGSSSKPESGA